MNKKTYKIDKSTIDYLIIICKRDGNAPAYIALELERIITIVNDLGSWIKLRNIQSFIAQKQPITKKEYIDYYTHIIKLLQEVGNKKQYIVNETFPLIHFLNRLKEANIKF